LDIVVGTPSYYSKGQQPVPGFRLVQYLGRGAFGEVWRAAGPGAIDVALKILPLDARRAAHQVRVLRMLKTLRHVYLAPILALWLKDGDGRVVDDGADGDALLTEGRASEAVVALSLGEHNLRDRLEDCRTQGRPGIPAEELLGYLDGVARALDFLNQPIHDAGAGRVALRHGGVKPQNILRVGREALLCDAGLNDARKTDADDLLVSVPYTSPEIFEANKPSDSSDQYALAVTYYELRTGQLPFDNPANLAATVRQIMEGRLDLSRLTNATERDVIQKATARDPEARYPNAQALVWHLRRAVEGVADESSRPQTAAGPDAPGTEVVPGYHLVRRLGEGGYGTVWEAEAPGGKRVAVKVIRGVQEAAGRQEFRALELVKALEHESLLELHAFWFKDEQGAVIPDALRGRPDAPVAHTLVIATTLASKNLHQRLKECQREGRAGIPAPELLRYLRQAAGAIDFLNEPRHPIGGQLVAIQHRDIKPENILLVAGAAKVSDFGLAKILEGARGQLRDSSLCFTPYYAAPEVFRGEVSNRTDQYSLAITYVTLRTGALPFPASLPVADVMMRHLEGRLDLGALPEAERAVIGRAASREPDQRFPTCLDLVRALEQAALGAPAAAENPIPGARPPLIEEPTVTPPPIMPGGSADFQKPDDASITGIHAPPAPSAPEPVTNTATTRPPLQPAEPVLTPTAAPPLPTPPPRAPAGEKASAGTRWPAIEPAARGKHGRGESVDPSDEPQLPFKPATPSRPPATPPSIGGKKRFLAYALPRWLGGRGARPVTDRVDCTVFAPPRVSVGQSVLIQVFAHLPRQAAEAKQLAQEFDDRAERRGFQSLETEIERDSRLTVQLTVPGLDVDEAVRHLIWQGRTASVQFEAAIPAELPPGTVIGTVLVSQHGEPIGHIKFKLERTPPGSTLAPARPLGRARRYEFVFISYSSQDRAEVLKRVQMLKRLKIQCFQDVLNLEPGDRWEKELYRYIDQSDLFLLFWSRSAKESEWVMKEVRYALQCQGERTAGLPEILPVILEGPPIPAPPPELRHLHFNDQILHFLRS
jgi:serine/threonine protein kinase